MKSEEDELRERRGYRDPAEPPPARFALRMGDGARLGLVLGAGALALTITIVILTGRAFLLVLAACGPGLFYLLSGAPRAIEVGRDEIVISYRLRPVRRLRSADIMSIQVDDEDLLLVSGDSTIAIGLALFEDRELDRCVDALRAVTARP